MFCPSFDLTSVGDGCPKREKIPSLAEGFLTHEKGLCSIEIVY
jgi:hypothetical protein